MIGITKGQGFEGPVTRLGIKRKQHKSRKSVRAVGVIGPWHPAAVMYTVARAGQHGFHQRTETGKRIIIDIQPEGYARSPRRAGSCTSARSRRTTRSSEGSVPGTPRRVVVVRHPVRAVKGKTTPVQLIELSTRTGR